MSLVATQAEKAPLSASALPISTALSATLPPATAGSVTEASIGRPSVSVVRKRPTTSKFSSEMP
jgi:hypothetical protein